MRRRPSPSAWHLTCLLLCAALVSACGSSTAHSGPTTSAASTPPSTSTVTSTPSTVTSTPAGVPVSKICGPAAARTLAADRRARVYVAGGQVVGCAHGGSAPLALGRATTCLGGALAGPVAVSGVRVAYALKTCGVDTGRSAVVVRALNTGQVISQRPATATVLGPESYVTVSSIVLAPNGAVAWITEAASIVSHRRAIQVHASGPAGARILDSGPGIAAQSLHLHGRTLRWRDAGQLRTARLG